jgi:uncharacterized repeat protein (TIGR04076 family)
MIYFSLDGQNLKNYMGNEAEYQENQGGRIQFFTVQIDYSFDEEERLMAKYKVIAKAKDSKCSYVKEGDQMVIEGTMVNLKETDSLCAVALGAIQYSLFIMGKANDPKDFGRQDVYTLQCPDPETRVIFEITRKRVDD